MFSRLSDMGGEKAHESKHISDDNCSLYASQQKVNKRQQQREPKTREEAQRQWKELQNTPDHLGLLKVYKRAGIEPIKLAKYVAGP